VFLMSGALRALNLGRGARQLDWTATTMTPIVTGLRKAGADCLGRDGCQRIHLTSATSQRSLMC
jgi:hypothetical protein